MDSTCEKICVGNGRPFYSNDDGKLVIYYILKIRYHGIKNNSSFIFTECNEINFKNKYANEF